MPGAAAIDRPGAIRTALRELVAERGFHGASMSAVARRAGVATGTAYVHYASKDELVLAAYAEAKRRLGEAAVAALDEPATARDRFVQLWMASVEHLRANPDDARFLVQVDGSPYATVAHASVLDGGDDPLMAEVTTSELWSAFADLPPDVLYDLGLAPAVRIAAREGAGSLTAAELETVALACWAAVTVDAARG